jgi:hypothetical protein
MAFSDCTLISSFLFVTLFQPNTSKSFRHPKKKVECGSYPKPFRFTFRASAELDDQRHGYQRATKMSPGQCQESRALSRGDFFSLFYFFTFVLRTLLQERLPSTGERHLNSLERGTRRDTKNATWSLRSDKGTRNDEEWTSGTEQGL